MVKAANEFHTKTIHLDKKWQAYVTYLKIIGMGWGYLSAAMVSDMLDIALAVLDCDYATVQHNSRLYSHNPSDCMAG